jgi:hypothetical protein
MQGSCEASDGDSHGLAAGDVGVVGADATRVSNVAADGLDRFISCREMEELYAVTDGGVTVDGVSVGRRPCNLGCSSCGGGREVYMSA